ncbi:hypothetical protein [Neobacillus sp. LXY-4]|uniref:hypothetical protein n=1 Tax=Neobacillus sp. LXY-4 TaxID=3379826 RepID=UPI003EE1FE91
MSEELKSLIREVIKEELSDFRRTITELQNDLIELRTDAADRYEKLKYVLENLDQRMEALEKNNDEMGKNLEKIEHDHDRRDRKISSIIVQYQHLESFISKEIKRLGSLQNNQKTIDLLSARSIQHEAELKELNRVVMQH